MTGIDLDQHRFPVKCHQSCPAPALSPLALPPSRSVHRSHLFLVHNPARVRIRVHTVPRTERELLSGHSTPLPTVFLDYYRRSCAHNLCFPSTVRKRAVRQRRAHNDATTLR